MPKPLRSAAALCLAASGGALADHQAPNLRPFKIIYVSGYFTEQGKKNDAVLDGLLRRLTSALDSTGIRVADNCEAEDGVGGQTQLNLYFAFATTRAGTVYDAALVGWLNTEGPFTDVTLWRDSFFGAVKAGTGAEQAAGDLDELLDGFIGEWDSVH